MARHRNIRTLNYDDVLAHLDDYGSDEYGSSLDNGCITPETENMYTYARERHNSVSKIWEPQNPPVKEEDEDHLAEVATVNDDVVDTAQISTHDQAKLFECLEAMRSVVGDSVPDALLREAAISRNFNPDEALNVVFDRHRSPTKDKAQYNNAVESTVSEAEDPLSCILNQDNFSIDDLLNASAPMNLFNSSVAGNVVTALAPPLAAAKVPSLSVGGRKLFSAYASEPSSPANLFDSILSADDILGTNSRPGPGLDLRQLLSDNTEKVDVLDKLMKRVEPHEITHIFETSPSGTVSPVARILRHLKKRNDRVLKETLDWFTQRPLSALQRFLFEILSPDDTIRIAREHRATSDRCKAHGSQQQTKTADSHQHNELDYVRPAGMTSRMTFSGRDSGPKAVEAQVKTLKTVEAQVKTLKTGEAQVKTLKKLEKDQQPMRKLSPPPATKSVASPKPGRISRTDPEAIQEQYKKERSSEKPLLNLVVVGHVDAGKSTLMGHLLFLTGNVNKKTMSKFEHESKKIGKASFAYAWVLDETTEERARGITMDMAYAKLITENRAINILDAPGHKDFIPNMITGAAQADVAILVVNATRGEFETGFELGGQTREHTMLVRSLGVAQLAVCVNKLDICQWSEKRFDEIVAALKPFLKQTGFSDSKVSYIPCSGLSGENLHTRTAVPELTKWYRGPCLLEVIDNMKPPPRPITRPLRMCVADVFKGMQSGVCVSGKIESGSLAQGDKLLIMPSQEPCVVRSLQIDDNSHGRAFAGDNIVVNLDKCDPTQLAFGSVLCDPNEPIRAVSKFEAKVVIFNVDIPIIKGSSVVLHFQSLSEQAFFGKLVKELNRNTGEVVRERPRFLSKNSSGVVVIKVARPICVELYQDCKELGRITLRQAGNTIAAGVVTALL